MSDFISDWLHFALRWFHLIAGISWIGNSFYFMWLDQHLDKPAPGKDPKKVEGELWMVHSGGFYQVEKRKIQPHEMPPVLHWFKWEATFTWLTGFGLLSLIFYSQSSLYLLLPDVPYITPTLAVVIGIGSLVLSWIMYDLLWISPLAKGESSFKTPATWVSLALLCVYVWGYSQVFSGRGLYIHVGAVLGTLMVLNVWIRILPAQKLMIAATARGELPNFDLGKRAKKRSVHNSYVTLPVLFVMMSNHFPMTYQNSHSLWILAFLFVLGMSVRHIMIKGVSKAPLSVALVVFSLAGLLALTKPKPLVVATQRTVTFEQVQPLFAKHCFSCHSEKPTDRVFTTAPLGLKFDQTRNIQAYAGRIKTQVVVQKVMPLNNETKITDAERTLIGTWIDEGAIVP